MREKRLSSCIQVELDHLLYEAILNKWRICTNRKCGQLSRQFNVLMPKPPLRLLLRENESIDSGVENSPNGSSSFSCFSWKYRWFNLCLGYFLGVETISLSQSDWCFMPKGFCSNSIFFSRWNFSWRKILCCLSNIIFHRTWLPKTILN